MREAGHVRLQMPRWARLNHWERRCAWASLMFDCKFTINEGNRNIPLHLGPKCSTALLLDDSEMDLSSEARDKSKSRTDHRR